MKDNLKKLEDCLTSRGTNDLITFWRDMVQQEPDQALESINDPALTFPVLYALTQELEKDDDHLSIKNKLALYHIHSVLNGEPFYITDNMDLMDQFHYSVECFSWILETGGTKLGDQNYSEVVDQTCIHLLHHLKVDCLKQVVDIIFYRHRNEGQIHYLLTTFYDSPDPKGLLYVVKYLRSSDHMDVALAKKILAFIPEVQHVPDYRSEDLVMSWLEDNQDYLVHTRETNDSHAYPIPFTVNLTAKYFGLPINTATGNPLTSPIQGELEEKWSEFQALPQHIQNRLSNYSSRLRKWNRIEWNAWRNTSVETQASILMEGRFPYDYY